MRAEDPQKLILKCGLPPGDVVTLTAAVRDLHTIYKGKYVTDVRTNYPELWVNSPYITKIEDGDQDAWPVQMHYPAINKSNQYPVHFISGYSQYLGARLNLEMYSTAFKGDIHLNDQERNWTPQVGGDYWIVDCGGKNDFTTKWPSVARLQKVIDHFNGVKFVQIGHAADTHPKLRGVVDLIGQTDMRQLVRLMYHAKGVISPLSLPVHLAAAVPTKDDSIRPCVVIAGGREPAHWVRYPNHTVLENVGTLDCCKSGACWRSRVVALNDGDSKDKSLCEHPVDDGAGQIIPLCVDRFTADDLIRAVGNYL